MSSRFKDKKERDLFDQIQTSDKKTTKKGKFLLPWVKDSIILSFENIIVIVIGFVMSGIILFSLGVEKGRQDINGASIIAKGTPIARSEQEDQRKERRKLIHDNYIVQLAAFTKKDDAKKEMTELKKDGYNANIKQSGKYYQLYIGFDKERTAQALVKKLKKRYNDCYIKVIE